jgi:hypothetical protein
MDLDPDLDALALSSTSGGDLDPDLDALAPSIEGGFSHQADDDLALVRTRTLVVHDYHDHLDDKHRKATASMKPPQFAAAAPSWSTDPFPKKLYEMLAYMEEEGGAKHIISWQPHGRCFVVHSPREFVKNVLPT